MRLPAVSSSSMFSLLACDQILALSKLTGLNVSDPKNVLELEQIVQLLTKTLTPDMTGVVLSSEVGYPALMQKNQKAGLVFCLERKLIEPDPYTIPLLQHQWNVEAVANNYALAKLELYFNPNEAEAVTKLQMIAELHEFCQHLGIDFILEVIVVVEAKEKDYKQLVQQSQIEAIQAVRKHCDLIALEFPVDAFGSVTVTAELDIPWILTARDTPYDQFKENLRTALESGAKGYYAVEQFLPKFETDSYDSALLERFVATQGKDRAIELTRIVTEATA